MESPQYFQPTDMAKSIDVEEFTKQMALNSIDTFSTLFEDLVRARQEGVPYFNSRYFRYSFKICGTHMGAEVQNSFKEVPRRDQYGKLTMRHQGFRKYVSPNQTCPVF